MRRTPHSLRPPRSEVKYVYESLPRTPSVWGRLLYCRCLLKIRDDLQELSSVLLRLEAAHAAHVLELTQIPWLGSRHLPQGLVGENHKSRHAPEAGQVGALLPQPLEEGLLPLCQGAVLRPPAVGRRPLLPNGLHHQRSVAVRHVLRPLPAPEDRVLAVSELQDVLVHQEADAVLDLPLTQGGQGSIGPLPLQPVTADLLVLPPHSTAAISPAPNRWPVSATQRRMARASSPTSISWKLWRQL